MPSEHPRSIRGEFPSIEIVRAVAEMAGSDPLELPPLADVIDPDALDSLIGPAGPIELEFRYHGFRVTVTAEHTITVDPVIG